MIILELCNLFFLIFLITNNDETTTKTTEKNLNILKIYYKD